MYFYIKMYWFNALVKESLNYTLYLWEIFGFGSSPLDFTEETPDMHAL